MIWPSTGLTRNRKWLERNQKSFINSKMPSLKMWVRKYNNKWKGQRLIFSTLICANIFPYTKVCLSSVFLFAAVVNKFCFWSSGGTRSAFCFPLRTPRVQKPWDGEQQWCKQERGRSGSIDYYGPASRILQRKSGQLDHRAAVQLADCFSARQREVGAASDHRATTVQRENQKSTPKGGEKTLSTAAAPSISPGLLHPQFKRIKILPWGTDVGCSSATTMSCCAVCCKLTFKTELDFWTGGPWGGRAMYHY